MKYGLQDSGTFFAWMEKNARDTPDKLAIRSLDQAKDITHGELFAMANRIGRFY